MQIIWYNINICSIKKQSDKYFPKNIFLGDLCKLVKYKYNLLQYHTGNKIKIVNNLKYKNKIKLQLLFIFTVIKNNYNITILDLLPVLINFYSKYK